MTRETKTPQARAQEALDVAERRVKKLHEKKKELDISRERLVAELDEAMKRRDYLAQNPDLKDPS